MTLPRTSADYLDTGAFQAGNDYYVYALDFIPTGKTLSILVSLASTFPLGATADNSRKIGGFHTPCIAAGTIPGHSLTDFAVKAIPPASVWRLNFRPRCEPAGMVYSDPAKIRVDIYPQSGTGAGTLSVYGATIKDTVSWREHVDDPASVGKKLLNDSQFQSVSKGSNQKANIAGAPGAGYWTFKQKDVSPAAKDAEGSATLSTSGAYTGEAVQQEWIVQIDSITAGSEVGLATFRYSLDGGETWLGEGILTWKLAPDTVTKSPAAGNATMTISWKYGSEDDSKVDYSEGGQPWTKRRRPRRLSVLPWNTFRIEDKYWRFCFFRDKVGLSQDWIIDALPEGTPSERWFTTLFGRFKTLPELTATSRKHSSLELEIVESH